jgi:DNA helicase HerA-like ATPase
MKFFIGLSETDLLKNNRDRQIHYEPARLINAHMLICGMSGTGKSYQCRRFLESAAKAGIEADVFDVHEELDDITGAVSVKYSQATGYGFNPLVLSADPHSGGVVRQCDFIVGLINQASASPLGVKQEAALRALITDTYAANGIFADNPKTWARKEISEAERTNLLRARRYDELRQFYPTLEDLKSYALKKISVLTIGGNDYSITAFNNLSDMQKRLSRMNSKWSKSTNDLEKEKLEAQIETAKHDALAAYEGWLASLKTGKELEDVLKYTDSEVLISVLSRLELIGQSGIFRSTAPPFNGARMRVHAIKALTNEQQIVFVKQRLRAIFEEAKAMGPTRSGTEVRRIIFLDEAHKYFHNAAPDDIVSVIAREARKFGIGLWCASQQPIDFPQSFLTNVGATILLGIHASFWAKTSRMLRVAEDDLKLIRPKSVLSIKLMTAGEADPPFINVRLPNPNSPNGVRAMRYANVAA